MILVKIILIALIGLVAAAPSGIFRLKKAGFQFQIPEILPIHMGL